MFLPYLIYSLLAFYGALFLLLAYCACKPSCRICVHRDACPMRLRGAQQFFRKPICTTPHSQGPVRRPMLVFLVAPSDRHLHQIHTGR
jgi:hypothetical protein